MRTLSITSSPVSRSRYLLEAQPNSSMTELPPGRREADAGRLATHELRAARDDDRFGQTVTIDLHDFTGK
jgi:hypothetical protein